MPAFDYSRYYRRIQDLKKLQIPADAMPWTERHEAPDRAYDVVLYLGCNILRTPDVAADVVAVFKALDIDFIAVAGVQFCCGVTWDKQGDTAKGQNVSVGTIERLAAYKPRLVVQWCPSCDVHFSDVVEGRDAKTLPFAVTNAPAFLRDLDERGRIAWRHPVAGRMALHTHAGREGHAAGQRRSRADRDNVGYLLGRLPGGRYLGAVGAPPEFDFDCGPSLSLPRERWLAIRAGLLEETRALGADTMVTVSHACQREWCDAADESLAVRNYISLIAESLGCARSYQSNTLGELKQIGEPDAIVARTEPNWSSHGLDRAEATELARRYIWLKDAPRTDSP